MDKERLKDLLFSYLNDTLGQEEFEELLGYVNDPGYTDVFYESMDHEWQNKKIKKLLSDAEQEVVYNQILSDPRFSGKRSAALNVFTWRRISVAAAILVVLSFGTYFYALKNNTSFHQYANDVKPGGNKAILTLTNGKTISLSDFKKGVVINAGNLRYNDGTDVASRDTSLPAEALKMTLSTPKGGTYEVMLSDSTRIWLNAASSIKFPPTFLGQKERRVKLSGEAYFEVAKNKKLPFIVETDQQEVKVLGTHFNINSYAEEPGTKTTLLEGSVLISSSQRSVTLVPGQQAAVSMGAPIELTAVDAEAAIAWKKGDLILKDEDFKATMRKIARWYDVDVIYDATAPEDLELGGWVSKSKNISVVLKIMELTGKVHFKIEGRRIIVTK